MKIFILKTVLGVHAGTPEEAELLLALNFKSDQEWEPFRDHIEIFSPEWPPIDEYDEEDVRP